MQNNIFHISSIFRAVYIISQNRANSFPMRAVTVASGYVILSDIA